MGSDKITAFDLEEPVVETLNTVDNVAEQISDVNSDTDSIKAIVEDNATKLASINENVDNVNLNVDNSKTLIEDMKNKLDTMEVRINAGLQQNSLDSSAIAAALSGASSPYGTGILGKVEYDPSTFLWGSTDHLGRYMLYTDSFTLPEGVTMTPPERCNGVYIFSKGDVVINGTIDLRSKRILSADVSIPDTITVDGVEYALAKGGDSQKGGNGGASGKIVGTCYVNFGASTTANSSLTLSSVSGGTASAPVAGSVVGGGYGSYGKGATGASTTAKIVAHSTTIDTKTDAASKSGTTGSIVTNTTAPCALVIIAAGDVIVNGEVIANGGGAIAATSAGSNTSTGSATSGSNTNVSSTLAAGNGGNGTCPPSGGGPVTCICNTFICNGKINTSGSKIDANTPANGSNATPIEIKSDKAYTFEVMDNTQYFYAYAFTTITSQTVAKGGTGVTCISTAGEIKVYERGA